MSYPSGPNHQFPPHPPTYPPPPSQLPSRWPRFGTNAGVLLYVVAPLAASVLILTLVGSVLLITHRIGVARLAPRPTPTATSDPNAHWREYLHFVANTIQPLLDDGNQMSTSCQNTSDLNPCYTALQTLDDDTHRAQAQLDTQTTPPCLQPAVTDLRSSLTDVDHAAQEYMSAIEQESAYLLDTAVSHFQQAARALSRSDAEIRAAPCITPTSG